MGHTAETDAELRLWRGLGNLARQLLEGLGAQTVDRLAGVTRPANPANGKEHGYPGGRGAERRARGGRVARGIVPARGAKKRVVAAVGLEPTTRGL
jgi:hypothetical protein